MSHVLKSEKPRCILGLFLFVLLNHLVGERVFWVCFLLCLEPFSGLMVMFYDGFPNVTSCSWDIKGPVDHMSHNQNPGI